MSDYIIALSKDSKNVRNENLPNSFIFHSDYNSFKIIKSEIVQFQVLAKTNNQQFTVAHGLSFTPLVTAFAQKNGSGYAYPPNCAGVDFCLPKTELSTNGISFKEMSSNSTNVIFVFDSSRSTTTTMNVRYFCLEVI
jgi:hypothetical protein